MKSSEQLLLKQRDSELSNMFDQGKIDDFISSLFQVKAPYTQSLKKIIKSFESEYLSLIKNLNDFDKSKTLTEVTRLSMLNPKLFSQKFTGRFTSNHLKTLASLSAMESKPKYKHSINIKLMSYLSLNPENKTAKNIVKEYLQECPEVIANACEEEVSIKSNYITNEEPKVKSLFNSPQEKSINMALEACFPNLYTYPNKVLHELFPYDLMKSNLSQEKFDFFLKSTMDFVVYQNEMPIYFFEIDSSFHDSIDLKRKDRWKDDICKLAEVKLIRIRPEHPNQTSVDDFKRIVTTCMNQHLN
ncbi:hypothetical protein N9I31_05160 [Candidatus Pseudothioglobus singularis]|nr:hypothetical protein [Candidatus Pseudothioglobus singularis]